MTKEQALEIMRNHDQHTKEELKAAIAVLAGAGFKSPIQ